MENTALKEHKIPAFSLLGDRVAIVPDPRIEKTEKGLIIPDAFADKQTTGTVVAVGPGDKDYSVMFMKAGDRVIYHADAGALIEYEGQELRLVRAIDVYAVI